MIDLSKAPMADLVKYFNANSGLTTIKRFADRKTALKRIESLKIKSASQLPAKVIDASPGKPARAAEKPIKASTPQNVSRSQAIANTWQDKAVAAARANHTNVEVGGTTYRSVREAFRKLGLPDSKHVKFRAALKKAGKLDFEGKTFTTVKK